jgi:imidazolonepropionase-like amidohydrolase
LTLIQGNPEDFIPVDGDPLADMSDIRQVTLTVKNGTVFRPTEMYQAIGVGQ